MPKKTKHPRFRTRVRKGANGQRWVSYAYDMRPDGKPDVSLGTDYDEAVKQWEELHHHKPRIAGTLCEGMELWRKERLDDLETRYEHDDTRKDYRRQLARVEAVLGGEPWHAVDMPMLKKYLKQRKAKTQGNRELAVLSIVWNYAILAGLTKLPFPAASLKRSKWKNKETPRNFDVTDAIFDALYKHAEPHLKDAMDLATATAMRLKDVVKLQITDQRGDILLIRANKTGKPAPYDLAESVILPALLERRKNAKAPHFWVLTKGTTAKQVTLRMLEGAFDRARIKALPECPELKGVYLRDMRKRASKLAGSRKAASELLQHSSEAVTERHYPVGNKLRPVR